MDIQKQSKRNNHKPYYLIGFALLVMPAFWVYSTSKSIELEQKNIETAYANRGDIEITINGFGTLRSTNLQLLTAATASTVVQVLLEPGAKVTPDSVVLKMENQELEFLAESEYQALLQEKSNLEQQNLKSQRDILEEQMMVADLKSQSEYATLLEKSHRELHKQGIVSSLLFQESVLNRERTTRNLELQKERLVHLNKLHEQAQEIKEKMVLQQERKVNLIQRQLTKLNVKAGIYGVLQKRSVELGQQVQTGQELAVVGSTENLVAMLRIPQSKIRRVNLGQSVEVDLRSQKVMGKVSRIEPAVSNNTVGIEVTFTEPLPSDVRPEMNVEGKIIVKRIENVVYVKAPVGISEGVTKSMYVLDQSTRTATRREIQFGAISSYFVQVLSGLSENEELIIAGADQQEAEKISILN